MAENDVELLVDSLVTLMNECPATHCDDVF